MTDLKTAENLAARIGAASTEALLDWGAAARDAQRDPTNETKKMLARRYGELALKLAMSLAEKLRP